MTYLRMLRQFQILQNDSCGYHTVLQMVNAKAFHVLHMEVLQQLLHGRLLGKHPVIELKGEELRSEMLLKILLALAVYQHFFRLEVTQHLFYIVMGTLTR